MGSDRRIERHDELVPWAVQSQHRWAYPLMMLRAESRRRAGSSNSGSMQERLDTWLAKMHEDDTVVAYVPDSDEGFRYVPRAAGDTDLVREPAG